jgi:CRISPR/Cas system Type II protein with McrA/HNH and RuvC-like nuclease domain
MNDKVDKIFTRMIRHRLKEGSLEDWNWENTLNLKVKSRERIKELVEQGKIVTAGYFPTQVRGYHDKFIIWRDRK